MQDAQPASERGIKFRGTHSNGGGGIYAERERTESSIVFVWIVFALLGCHLLFYAAQSAIVTPSLSALWLLSLFIFTQLARGVF